MTDPLANANVCAYCGKGGELYLATPAIEVSRRDGVKLLAPHSNKLHCTVCPQALLKAVKAERQG